MTFGELRTVIGQDVKVNIKAQLEDFHIDKCYPSVTAIEKFFNQFDVSSTLKITVPEVISIESDVDPIITIELVKDNINCRGHKELELRVPTCLTQNRAIPNL